MTVNFYSSKGGQGTTTLGVAYALTLARLYPERDVLLGGDGEDVSSVLGLPERLGYDQTWPLIDNLYGTTIDARADVTISRSPSPCCMNVVVVRCDYLSLRRMVGTNPDVVITIREPGSSLSAQDAVFVVGYKLGHIECEFDPAVRRSVDAGLLAGRMPRNLAVTMNAVHQILKED